MHQPAEAATLRREVRVAARPETVFEFFTDPEKLVRWMGVSAELEPRPGGIWRLDLDGRGALAVGEYVSVNPPRSVVFTWGWSVAEIPLDPGESTVEVTLTPEGDGTLVELVHRGLSTSQLHAFHAFGWTHYLKRLGVAGGGADPGADPMPDMIASGALDVAWGQDG